MTDFLMKVLLFNLLLQLLLLVSRSSTVDQRDDGGDTVMQ